MILYQNCYCIVFILIYLPIPLLSGESTRRDVDEVYDQFQINTEEILRRRKLIEPHLSNIAEKQKEWIETYHMSFSTGKNSPMQNPVPEDPALIKHPVHEEISSIDTSTQVHSEVSPLDPKERERRYKIVEDFTPELKNLEEVAETSPPFGSEKYRTESDSFFDLTEKIQIFQDDEIEEMASKIVINNEPRLVDTKSKVVDSMKSKEAILNWRGNEHLSGLSKLDLNHTDNYHCLVGNMKENFHIIVKELTDIKNFQYKCHKAQSSYEITNEKKYEANNPISKFRKGKKGQEEFKKYDNFKSTEKLHGISEALQRQIRVKSFLSSLNKKNENWKETYNFAYDATNSMGLFKSVYSEFIREENRNVLPNHSDVDKNLADVLQHLLIQERLYFYRWLKKLLNKFADYPFTEHISISFAFTRDSLNDFRLLSTPGKYDISKADELISDLIFNATVHPVDNLNSWCNSYATIGFYIIVSIIFSFLLCMTFLYYPLFRIIFLIIICVLWHGFKMYQEKIAEKHATVSGSSPAYCESILTTESGIFAHIKEAIRYKTYNDHCQEYYKALMIDPISELSVFDVIFDLISSTFSQVFRLIGRALNVLVKDLFKGLGFVQSFQLIVTLIFIFLVFVVFTLIYNKYKLKLPFFMGSIEPSGAHHGSRIEDITLKPSIKTNSPSKCIVSKNSDMSDLNHTKFTDSQKKVIQSYCRHKVSKALIRRLSF